MTSLPGLLVEHLISGSITLLWIFISYPSTFTKGEIEPFSLFLIPVAYILGMFIDFTAFLLTYAAKRKVRNFAQSKYNKNHENVFDKNKAKKVKALIEHRYKDVQQQIDMRSSRDRIARGMIINALCIMVFIPMAIVCLSLKISLLVFAIITWVFFEYISYAYFLRMYSSLLSEIEKDNSV